MPLTTKELADGSPFALDVTSEAPGGEQVYVVKNKQTDEEVCRTNSFLEAVETWRARTLLAYARALA